MAARPPRRFIILAGVGFAIAIALFRPQLESNMRDLFPYGEMRIGVDASNPPFAAVTADDLFGLEIDLGKALAEHFSVPVRFVNMSFDGLYDSLVADQVDLVIAALTIDPLRTGDVVYTRHYFDAGLVLVSDTQQPVDGMDKLSERRLAYEFGSNADALARRWLRRIAPFELQPYELPSHALDAVYLEHADAALVEAAAARLYLREHGWQAHLNSVTSNGYPIAVRVDRSHLRDALNKALVTLDDNGTLNQIIDRWL